MDPSVKHSLLELEIEKADLLYRQNVTGMIAILVNTSAFIYYAWGSLPESLLFSWFLVLNGSTLVRFLAYKKWQAVKNSIRYLAELKKWLRLIYCCLGISGLGWGTLGWMSAYGTPGEQVLAGLIIAAMSAGAMITYVSDRIAMSCVVAPAMSLWAFGLLTTGQSLNQLLGSLIIFYMGLLVLMGKNLHATVINALMLDAKLKKSEERLRMSMDSSDSLTWDWDLSEKNFYWEGNVGLFPEGPSQLQSLLSPFIENRMDIDCEHMIQDRKGVQHYVAIRGRFYRDSAGVPFRFAGICWDVTVKKNEEFLRQERDLHEAANKAKSVLLANASHELRTPLAAIIGFSEALLRNSDLAHQNRKDVQSIYRQGHYMISLVNDLLDLSKIETNRLYIQKAPMNPGLEIEESLSAMRNVLYEKGLVAEVVYKTQIPREIQADSVRFRQVLVNVLNNAIKFSSCGKISIVTAMSVGTDNQAMLRIQIADQGIGMDELTQSNLFQPFIRGEAPEVQRVQGSGLGLALSRSLMRMMGGELRLLRSAPQAGSTFELCFDIGPADKLTLTPVPTSRVTSAMKVHLAEEGGFLRGRRVLVVDDSVDLRLLMRRYLNRQGASVETSENGKEAVEVALRDPFDIILMDIKMPVMDGYQATALLREKGYRKPIVALTAQASVDGQQRSYETGFDGYLSKPVDMGLLKEILKDKAEFA